MTSHQINTKLVAFCLPNAVQRLIDVRLASAGGVSIGAVAASAARP